MLEAIDEMKSEVQEEEPFMTGEKTNEALFLFVSASIGVLLNSTIVICILSSRTLRQTGNAFILHGCLLDVIRSAYCFPFGQSLLRDVVPSFCSLLGASYVIFVTVSGFNLVAMTCCEAFTFSERRLRSQNIDIDTGKDKTAEAANLWCVAFGVLMVYIGSVVIQLGPTIIGGDFNYNELIGNCIFSYGTVKSYVTHAMWMAIMTLAMTSALYYLVYFHRHIQSAVRLPLSPDGAVVDSADQLAIRIAVRDSLCRSRVLALMTSIFIVCWYPLYLLTLIDPRFQLSTKIYKLLTFVAWSNGALNPLVLLLFDRQIGAYGRSLLRYVVCCRHGQQDGRDGSRLGSRTNNSTQLMNVVTCDSE